jgi:hypothetical protein
MTERRGWKFNRRISDGRSQGVKFPWISLHGFMGNWRCELRPERLEFGYEGPICRQDIREFHNFRSRALSWIIIIKIVHCLTLNLVSNKFLDYFLIKFSRHFYFYFNHQRKFTCAIFLVLFTNYVKSVYYGWVWQLFQPSLHGKYPSCPHSRTAFRTTNAWGVRPVSSTLCLPASLDSDLSLTVIILPASLWAQNLLSYLKEPRISFLHDGGQTFRTQFLLPS